MYKRVLVPLDGSTLSLQALPIALLVARSTGARIDLLSAYNALPEEIWEEVGRGMREGVAAKVDPAKLAELTANERTAAEAGLAKEAAALKDSGVTVGTIAAEGDPADAINAEAAKEPDTLIVISTHGRSGVGRWVMGSVTDKVVREASHATLVVRSQEGDVASAAPKISRVVLAVDGSATGEQAIPHAIAMAKALGTGITVLRAIPPTAFGDTFAEYVPAAYDDLYAEVEADAQAYASKISQQVKAAGISDVNEVAMTGYPGTAILEEVGEGGDKLAVMGTHGRSGVKRWVLGSVADRVIRHSTGPILVVRPS